MVKEVKKVKGLNGVTATLGPFNLFNPFNSFNDSLIPQRLHRIDSGCATRRHKAGDGRNHDQGQGDTNTDERFERCSNIKLAAYHAPGEPGQSQTKHKPRN